MHVRSCNPTLIQKISKVNLIQKWYVDDGNACGRISDIYETFRALKTEGPGYGYFVNAPECQVLVKKGKMEFALETFAGSNVQITLGTRVLGSVIGTQETCDKFVDGKSAVQKKLLSKLGDIAKTNPQNAHACLTKGVKHKVNFITRTTPSSSALLETSEAIIREHHSGANFKRRTFANRKGNILTATQITRTRLRLPRKPLRRLRTVKEVIRATGRQRSSDYRTLAEAHTR